MGPIEGKETWVRSFTRFVTATAAALVLVGCSSSTAPPLESTEADPVQPAVVEFDAGAAPVWVTDPEEFRLPIIPAVSVLGDVILLGEEYSGDVIAFDAASGEQLWDLESFSGRIGDGMARSLPLVTTSARDGLLVAGFTQECWTEQPCADAPEDAEGVIGVAGLAARNGRPEWTAVVAVAGPQGSSTHNDGIYLEVTVVDADADGVLVLLGTHDGDPTPAGTAGTTAVLLDATTGEERWRLDGFEPAYLTDDTVYGSDGHPRASGNFVSAAVDRVTGEKIDLALTGPERVDGAGGPGLLLNLENANPDGTGNLTVLGPQGVAVPTVTDSLRWALSTCARLDGLACVAKGRNIDVELLTWFPGEAAPTTATLWNAHLQLWGAADPDTLLLTENGYVTVNRDGAEASWFAVRRDGTVIGERRPGAVLAASSTWVVTQDVVPVDDDKIVPLALQVWQID